ncbi:AidA/PixA family protein [Burkholderia ubonensis]|uniref:AidA/PixA family protein n=1 Tax=Burkholderia ubonensis TaxID=101571 RepID=UPI0009B3C5B3|nr:AidA/PixA family protein [Burkholderia ubonensis]
MSTINIEVVFDADTIWSENRGKINGSNSADNPLQIGYDGIFMVASNKYVVDNQASATLDIKANVGDEIRWGGITLSENIKYSAIIYEIEYYPNPPQNYQGHPSTQVTRDPVANVSFPTVPIPNTENPVKYGPQTSPEYYLSADVLKKGYESYQVRFYITDNESGTPKTLGYFRWDPWIIVS